VWRLLLPAASSRICRSCEKEGGSDGGGGGRGGAVGGADIDGQSEKTIFKKLHERARTVTFPVAAGAAAVAVLRRALRRPFLSSAPETHPCRSLSATPLHIRRRTTPTSILRKYFFKEQAYCARVAAPSIHSCVTKTRRLFMGVEQPRAWHMGWGGWGWRNGNGERGTSEGALRARVPCSRESCGGNRVG
jgi:hypothetical protein